MSRTGETFATNSICRLTYFNWFEATSLRDTRRSPARYRHAISTPRLRFDRVPVRDFCIEPLSIVFPETKQRDARVWYLARSVQQNHSRMHDVLCRNNKTISTYCGSLGIYSPRNTDFDRFTRHFTSQDTRVWHKRNDTFIMKQLYVVCTIGWGLRHQARVI